MCCLSDRRRALYTDLLTFCKSQSRELSLASAGCTSTGVHVKAGDFPHLILQCVSLIQQHTRLLHIKSPESRIELSFVAKCSSYYVHKVKTFQRHLNVEQDIGSIRSRPSRGIWIPTHPPQDRPNLHSRCRIPNPKHYPSGNRQNPYNYKNPRKQSPTMSPLLQQAPNLPNREHHSSKTPPTSSSTTTSETHHRSAR